MRIAPWLVVCLLLGACALQPGLDLPVTDSNGENDDGLGSGSASGGSAAASGGSGGNSTTIHLAGAAGMGGEGASTADEQPHGGE